MRSGNGRHRRPRQVPALVVAAGVTGSAIAIPLLGATGASAADASTWDRVAECESGGMWSADFGNGHYGGLQISQETWDDFGGTTYAPTADQASRSQQIAVAEKILAAQGPSAWPTCALVTGLTADPDAETNAGTGDESDADAGGDTDTAPDSEASDEATQQPETPAESEPSEEAVLPPAPESTPSSGQFGRDSASGAEEPGTEPSAEPSTEAGTGTGKHRGDAAPEPGEDADAADGSTDAGKSGETGEGRESGRHASRGDGSTRADDVADGTYTVREGDNLWAIADEQKVAGGWAALYAANREVVGTDADLILPGQSLDLAPDRG